MKQMLIGMFFLFFLAANSSEYIEVDPNNLSMAPEEYVGVPIKLKCRFVKIDSTWLNDRGVYRSSDKYVGFVVESGDRIFAQLFYPLQEKAYLNRFESTDRLIIYGQVFSSKYNFPWVDVDKISEGWVVGEEPEEIKKQRIEVAKNYEEFLKARRQILRELKLDDVRDIFNKQEALIQLLIDKKYFTRQEFDRALSLQKIKPTPVPLWEKIFEEKK
jgi:hypothetical protein